MTDSPETEVPSHRACAHCRSQKVRCLPDERNPDVCQRCVRSGRPCVFTALQKRKQRKRTDTRVAELEREMRTMRAMLKNKQEGGKASPKDGPSDTPQGLWYQENAPKGPTTGQATFAEPYNEATCVARAASQLEQQTPQGSTPLWPIRFPDKPAESNSHDVVNRGMLSMATARQLVDTYRRDLFPHYPMVAIPESASADEMRRTKPTLFLAVIAAAAAKENSDLSATLDKEVLQAYATRSLVQSEKSLELVQALLISAVWYHPPSKFGQLKYYEYIHMAATMAMDIGIGTRPVEHRSRFGNSKARSAVHPIEDASNPDLSMTPRSRPSSSDTGSLNSRRTFLACYIICAGVSLSLRRPNMLRANSYIRECVEFLEQSANALPTDRTLVAWVKLVMIAEEISLSFSYDDPGGIASITELRTQMMLRDFQKRLRAWFHNVADADMNGSLAIMYYTVRLYLHEIALHVDHSPEDFRAPYQMGTVHSSDGEEVPTQVLAEAIAECITCSHALLDTFLAMDVDSLRALPVFSFVRVSFAAFILAKLCLSASQPGSRIGRALDRNSLKAESYLDRAILHVREIVGPLRCRVPAIFLALLFKLRQWCMNPQMIENTGHDPTFIETATQSYDKLPASAARVMMAVDEPRGTDQVSNSGSNSDDNSPRTLAGGQQVAFESVTGAAAQEAAYQATTNMASNAQPNYNYNNMANGTGLETAGTGVGDTQQTQLYMLEPDQMQLDTDFLASLGDMEGFPEGGLTGLDNWMPHELTNFGQLPDIYNWQATPDAVGGGATFG